MTVRVTLVIVVVLGVLSASSSARAGTYLVDLCPSLEHPSSGDPPWTQRGAMPGFYYVDLSCHDGQFFVGGQSSAAAPKGFDTGWQMSLPAPLAVQSMDIDWLGDVTLWSGWESQVWGRPRGSSSWLNVLSCAGHPCPGSLREVPMAGVASIGVGVSCSSYSTTCGAGTSGSMEVQLLRLRLIDPDAPVVTRASGPITNGGSISGQADVAFHVEDSGAGVRSVALEIDGREMASTGFDTTSHTCVPPYTRITPCPRAADGGFSFDTLALPDGPHQARLVARDATDRNVGIGGPWSFVTTNGTVGTLCAGAPVGASAHLQLRPRYVAYGRGAALTLSWPGNPWPRADAVLFSGTDKLSRVGTATQTTPTRFVAEVPAGATRVLRLGLRPLGSTVPFSCTSPIVLRARAGLSLRAWPRRVANGHIVRFKGRLAGGKAAAHRAVILEARAKGGRRRWIPVHVAKTNAKGTYRFAYRFERTYRRAEFFFRARFPVSPGFPYSAGHSRSRKVTVAP